MSTGHAKLFSIIGIFSVLLLFSWSVYSVHPREYFDAYNDDAIYFTTAKALATGAGYVIPSFPGVLPQTKYPILYPLILSLVWRLDPSFPANLGLANALSSFIAAIYLVLAYIFLRRIGASRTISLAITAAIAIHPWVSFLAGNLLSDPLLAALMLASAMTADGMCGDRSNIRLGVLTGLILGFAMLARTAAIGAIAGIVLFAMRRRCWRPLVACAVVCAVIVGVATIAIKTHAPAYVAAGTGDPPVAFRHVLTYYSSYVGMWRLSVPDASVFISMLWSNARKLMLAPGNYFIMAGFTLPANLFTNAMALLVTALAIGGIFRWSSTSEMKAILYIALGNVPILLLWNYSFYDRFLLPFLPLILLGIVIELRRVFSLLVSTIRSGDKANLIAAVPIALALLGILAIAPFNYWDFSRALMIMSEHRRALNRERREAYAWIAQNTPQTARIMAYEDGIVYLYTGRQAVRPVAISTDCYYQPEREKCASDFSELGTWAAYAHTQYFLADSDDLKFEGGRRFRPEVQKHIADLKARMRKVFVSSGGQVAVYDTTPLWPTPSADVGRETTRPYQSTGYLPVISRSIESWQPYLSGGRQRPSAP